MNASALQIAWKAYDFHPQEKIASLRQLFDTAASQGAAPQLLCQLAGDIQRLTMRPQPGVELLESIVAAHPDSVDALSGLAQGLRIDSQTDRAIEIAERGLELDPCRIDLLIVLTKLLIEQERLEEAEGVLNRLVAQKPEAAEHLQCRTYLKTGRIDEAYEICQASILREGRETNNQAMLSVLSHLMGDDQQLTELLDFELTQLSDQATHFGPETLRRENARLIRRLTDNSSLVFEPHSTATRLGSQAMMNELNLESSAQFVVQMIQSQVERYIEDLREDCVFAQRRPDELKLSIWCVVLNDQGHQRPHIHPAGWLSGVYYLQVPEFRDASGNAGALELGCIPDEYANGRQPQAQMIKPQTGQLLLFPSYFYHRTIPHTGECPRICIAFDVG